MSSKPIDLSKEEMNKSISEDIAYLKCAQKSFQEFVDLMDKTLSADATHSVAERCKELIGQ